MGTGKSKKWRLLLADLYIPRNEKACATAMAGRESQTLCYFHIVESNSKLKDHPFNWDISPNLITSSEALALVNLTMYSQT